MDDKLIPIFINKLKQEHDRRKKDLIAFAMSCSEYLSISEAFSLPYDYRKIVFNIAEERAKELNRQIKSSGGD